jgi:hypothetical protein
MHSAIPIDISGEQLPIEEILEISSYVSQNTATSDRIMALEALWTSVEANRAVLPGFTMAHFSYQDISTHEALELGVVNDELVLDHIERGTAKAIILTDFDLEMSDQSRVGARIHDALEFRFELMLTKADFGQRAANMHVFLRVD